MEQTMSILFARTATLFIAATVLVAGNALAQSSNVQVPRREAPPQKQVHDANQRIDEEYRKGNFTRQEAQALKLDERDVNRQSR
jgi:hypothetical protein